MKLHRLFSATVGLVLAASISAPSYAFMADSDVAAPSEVTGITAVVSGLRAELAAGETSCGAMLEKLNTVLVEIDAKLDAGVTDEPTYLAAREEIVAMRLSLPCLGDQLTELVEPSMVGGEIIPDGIAGPPMLGGEMHGPGMPLPHDPFIPGGAGGGLIGPGGYVTSGGGGGGGAAGGGLGGGGGLGALLGAGIAAGIAIPIATSDNNNPGEVVSPSTGG